MRDRTADVPALRYKHLSEVPTDLHELLFVDFEQPAPEGDMAAIGREAFEREGIDIVMATLGSVGLIVPMGQFREITTVLPTLRDAVSTTDDQLILDRLDGARARYGKAQELVTQAEAKYKHIFLERVDATEFSEGYRLKREEYKQLVENTRCFEDEAALAAVKQLGKTRVSGISIGERNDAERILRLMYEDASAVLGPLGIALTPQESPSVVVPHTQPLDRVS